jgi:citrate synthase
MNTPGWLSAEAALALLRVRPQSLYANVSRKRIRVRKDPDDPRRSLYNAVDVQRLAARRGRPSRERVAAEAVSWGSPVMESGVSTVAQGRLWYRGVDAVSLAARVTLEDAAALLWQSRPVSLATNAELPAAALRGGSPLEAVYLALAWCAGKYPPMYGRAATALHAEAAAMLDVVAGTVLEAIDGRTQQRRRLSKRRRPGSDAPLHQRLASAWRRPGAADLIRRALVLLADHELNASTFATRVAASTGACLPACLLAGFATLSGPLHGTAASRVAPLIDSAVRVGAATAIRECLERGEGVAAFGHPLYPEGDVRARNLLAAMPVPMSFRELQHVALELLGEQPNMDFALAALTAAMRLPADAPFVLFTLARTTGWIAHALEHQQRGALIRPRARYSGPPLAVGLGALGSRGPAPGIEVREGPLEASMAPAVESDPPAARGWQRQKRQRRAR